MKHVFLWHDFRIWIFLLQQSQLCVILFSSLHLFSYVLLLGMMLRMFTYLYDLEIVDEDTFMTWKEDINENYPGKGKALFQVSPNV